MSFFKEVYFTMYVMFSEYFSVLWSSEDVGVGMSVGAIAFLQFIFLMSLYFEFFFVKEQSADMIYGMVIVLYLALLIANFRFLYFGQGNEFKERIRELPAIRFSLLKISAITLAVSLIVLAFVTSIHVSERSWPS